MPYPTRKSSLPKASEEGRETLGSSRCPDSQRGSGTNILDNADFLVR